MVKIYKQPFAHSGDAIAIPSASQPDGKMSSADGWTPDYQLLKTDPNYKPVGRQEMNGVFKEVTESLGEVQIQGAATWSAAGAPYPISAQVYHNGKQWLALRANSVAPAEGEDWTELVGKQYVDANITDLADSMQPSMTGSITLNGTTDNTVVMTDIVTELALEVGDVIRIDTGAYNKLHTVESITYNSSIIVNYEHAGNRGNGSLKLPDFTGQATVTRIAKWFNAPIAMGQAWVDMKSLRTVGATYVNGTGRAILVCVSITNETGEGYLSVDGVKVSYSYEHAGVTGAVVVPLSSIVPNGSDYAIKKSEFYIGWAELR